MKKVFVKSLKFCVAAVTGILCPLWVLSCGEDSGLGSSVDTEAPKLEITYPPSLAVIREQFVFGGTWSDDKAIGHVAVEVLRTNSDESKTSVYKANANISTDGSWTINLNTYDKELYASSNGWQFCDGDYEVQAVAYDKAGRSSGTASRSFSIDNTPPLLVLTKPTSVGSNSAKSYGRTVQLEGTFSEACQSGISNLVVSFYSEAGEKLFDSEFSGITDMSNANPLVIAQYYNADSEPNTSNENYKKWYNYQQLYKAENIESYRTSDSGVTEQLYFSVTANDAAKIYNDFKGKTSVSGGNVTTEFYRGTTDMLNLINAKNKEFADFSVTMLRNYINKTDATYVGNENLQRILDEALSKSCAYSTESISSAVSNTETASGDVYLTFSVNPKNNPTYTVSGLAISPDATGDSYTEGYYNYFSDSAINVSITPGLDLNNLDTSTISIYYKKVGESDENKQLFWTWNEDEAVKYVKKLYDKDEDEAKAMIAADPKTYRYTITSKDENTDALSLSSSLSASSGIEEIQNGYKYEFSVEGFDIDGQTFIASDSNGFGFFASANGSSPRMELGNENKAQYKNLAALTAFKKDELDKLSFSGTIESESAISELLYSVTFSDTSSSASAGKDDVDISASLREGSSGIYEFAIDSLDLGNFTPADDKLYTVTLEIRSRNDSGKGTLTRSYYLDTGSPSIANVAISTGYIKGEDIYINNTNPFKLSGMTTDNYLVSGTSYEFTSNGGTGSVKSGAPLTAMSWSDSVNLSGLTGSGATLTVTATDSAGNVSSETYNIIFDTQAPTGKHVYDKKYKDLYFRVGEFDNESSEVSEAGLTWNNSLDKDVGGKYSSGTWGNSQTLTIRGTFEEDGSGLSMIYYKIFDHAPTSAEISSFKTNYASDKKGMFAPLSDSDDIEKYATRRVSYTKADGTKAFEEIQSSFRTTVSGFSAGSNYLVLLAVDNVGNVGIDTLEATGKNDSTVSANLDWNSGVAALSINVDTESPSITCTSHSGANYTNKTNEISISGKASDSASGVTSASIWVSGINSNGNPIMVDVSLGGSTEENWEATLTNEIISKLTAGQSYNVQASVTDKAGNSSTSTIFTLQVDTDSPKLKVVNPSENSTVNGVVSISGTTEYEGAGPTKLELYYSKTQPTSSTEASDLTLFGTIEDATKIYSWTFDDFDTYEVFDSSESNLVSKDLYIIPVVYDAAGNVSSFSAYTKYTVDRNSDRPVVRITSIDSADDWLKNAKISGTISDDDGIERFQISQNNSSWADVTVTNGSWSYTITGGDNENIPLYFKIVDTGKYKDGNDIKTGSTFTTGSGEFARPYYAYNSSSSESDNTEALLVNLDTAEPKIDVPSLVIGKNAESYTSTNSAGLDTVGNVAAEPESAEHIISTARYAGGDKKYIKVYVPVSEKNIRSVTLTIIDSKEITETTNYKTVESGNEAGITEDSINLVPTTQTRDVSGVEYTYYESPAIRVPESSFTDGKETTSGTKTLSFAVLDKAGNTKTLTKTFSLDNLGPDAITITSPSESDEVTGTINIVGTASDSGVGIKSIEWLVPPKDYTESMEDSALAALDGWRSDNNIKASASIFDFRFVSNQNTDLSLFDDTNQYKVEFDSSTNFYKIPIFFKSTDELGNIYIKRDYSILHNPDGDRPVTEFTYPTAADYDSGEEYATLAGTIRLSGTVEVPSRTASVGQVYIQIGSVAADGTVTWLSTAFSDEFTTLGGVITPTVSGTTVTKLGDYDNPIYVTSDWWGLKAETKSGAWSVSINSENGLNPTSGTNNIAIRSCAINENGKMGLWSSPVYIHVDANAPSQSAVLRQYSTDPSATADYEDSSKISIEKVYTADTYLKGKWYLVASLKDNDGLDVSSLKVRRGSASISNYELSDESTDSDGYKTRKLYVPIDTESMSGTTVTYTVYVEDNATPPHASTMTYSFYIDNTAPSFDTLKGNEVSLLGSTVPVVQNSNYLYTLGGDITEAGSGLKRVLFYFLREKVEDGSNVRILDAMVDSSSYATDYIPATGVTTEIKEYTVSQGTSTYTMYGKTYSGSLDAAGTTFTSTSGSLADNKHIRAGGLIFVGGEYHKISSVSGNAATFEDAVTMSVTEAGFPYGQVVDNTESHTMNDTTHKYTVNGDDGDEMVETFTKRATTYTWDGTIYSDMMSDGPVTIVCIAFDEAGNVAEKRIETSIQNNAPRIAKLYLGTDLSGDGKYSENEFNTYQFVTASADGSYKDANDNFKSSVDFETGGSTYSNYGKAFEIRSGFVVVPEFTGGNGTIKMAWLKDASSVTTYQKNGNSNVTFKEESTSSDISATFTPVKNATSGETDTVRKYLLDSSDLSGLTDGTGKAMSFTFWDSTDGTVCGQSSNYCFVRISDLVVALNDTKAPKSVIDPFKWNSLTDNSVYGSSATGSDAVTSYTGLQGHIELESDWETSSKHSSEDLASELRDSDPKVSGKITMKGYAYDDQRLSSLWVSFDTLTPASGSYISADGDYNKTAGSVTASSGTYVNSSDSKTYYQMAYYTPGSGWTASDAVISSGWEFAVEEEYLSQNGHKVAWTLSIDSEKIANTAEADVNARVIAFDHSYNVVDVSSVSTTLENKDGSDNVPLYQMDVVPYVTQVVTHLSPYFRKAPSVYARTVLGSYPVYEGETIQFVGFNLGTNTAKVTVQGMAETTLINGSVNGSSVANTITLTTGTGSGASSGEVKVTVNGVAALNNYNNNDALGSYTGDVSDTNYTYAYNRQPNNNNNNVLTDDLKLDVWQFLNAAEPRNGKSDNPTMKISPKGRIGISFSNAVVYFSAPFIDNGSTQALNNIKSQTAIAQNYGWFTNNTFCFDQYGYPYAAAQSPDTDTAVGAAYLQFFSRKAGNTIYNMGLNENYQKIANSSRIEAICIPIDSSETTWTTDIDRTQSLAMATSMPDPDSAPSATNKVTVHLAYWDNLTKQIRYRQGKVGANPGDFGYTGVTGGNTKTDSNGEKHWDSGTANDSMLDLQHCESDWPRQNARFNHAYDSISTNTNNHASGQHIYRVAGTSLGSSYASAYQVTTNYQGGKFVDIGVLPSTATAATPTVVLCWYDGVNKNLVLSYDTPSDSDTAKENNMYTGNWQSNAGVISSTGGMYCRMAIDADDGIHIAHYDSLSADLLYTYVPVSGGVPQTASAKTFTVDSFLSVGTWCTIDVAKDDSGNHVPRIGYFVPANEDTSAAARIAYPVKFDNGYPTFAGSDDSDMFTGNWEISTVPTTGIPIIDRVNVGVHKDSDGKLIAIPTGGTNRKTVSAVNKSSYPVSDSTTVYGNGTTNPAVVYCLDDGPVELAQKK